MILCNCFTDLFYVIETNNRDCELRLKTGLLDYEQKNKYLLTVRLVTVGGLFGKFLVFSQIEYIL